MSRSRRAAPSSGVRRRAAAAGVLAAVAAVVAAVLTGTAPPAVAAPAPPAAATHRPAVVQAPHASATRADWRSAARANRRPTAAVLAAAPGAGPVRVVTVTDRRGVPHIEVSVARNRLVAGAAVSDALADPSVVAVDVDAPARASLADDPYRADQWALTTLSAETLWPDTTGAGVVVAVVDTGVDAGHPDLAGVVLPGTDFVTDTGDGTADGNGHGTHVAGVVAAVSDNGIGGAGLAPGARILPVRVLDEAGSGYLSDVAKGIVWATDHGARVVNLSLGGTYDSAPLAAAVAYAASQGVAVVAAAGNSRQAGNPTSYPGAYPDAVAVAAADSSDAPAWFSTTGSWVDVAAPGVGIVSTVPGGYESLSGTSMATPYVSAAFALLMSRFPDATPVQLRAAVEATARDVAAVGRDVETGAGRLDVVRAGAWLASPVPHATSTRLLTGASSPVFNATVTVRAQATDTTAGVPLFAGTVRLCVRREPQTTYVCSAHRADSAGSISVPLRMTSATRVYATHLGGVTTTASTSATVRHGVRPVTGVTSRRAAFVLGVTPAKGQRVSVQRWTGTAWTTVATRSMPSTTGTTGATVTLSALRRRTTYRALVGAVPGYDATTTSAVRTG